MKRMSKLAALLGILGVALWAGTVRPAYAAPMCDTVHGTPCSPTGSTTLCTTSAGGGSICTCGVNHLWRCDAL